MWSERSVCVSACVRWGGTASDSGGGKGGKEVAMRVPGTPRGHRGCAEKFYLTFYNSRSRPTEHRGRHARRRIRCCGAESAASFPRLGRGSP